MKLVEQTPGSNLCGQACVATIAGVTLDEACMVMRTKGKTSTKQVKQALLQLGFGTAPRLKRGFPKAGLHILKFVHPDRQSHWVVWNNGKFYDPVGYVGKKTPFYLRNSKVTSHLRVYQI